MLVQDGIYDAFVERFAGAVAGLRVGSGREAGVNVGPLIDRPGLEKVERHVADARERGAELLLGGARHELGQTFFQPSVLTGVTADMAMSSEETFGPVAAIARFAEEAEAVRIANDTPYGLASYFFSRDVGRVWRVSEALEYGIVGINTGFISTEVAPFGGMKESGIGREGSKYGIDEWVEIKYLALGGIGEAP
jgi:succinate-semialdehyde dehydrogenase/glutarate-semialdehyde dehydrogenase